MYLPCRLRRLHVSIYRTAFGSNTKKMTSVKNHLENRKKSIFFPKKIKIFDFFLKISDFFRKFWYFLKNHDFFGFFYDFFDFRDGIFMDVNFFWCFGKENVSSFQKVLCLFTKYASPGLCMPFFEKNHQIDHTFLGFRNIQLQISARLSQTARAKNRS